MISVLKFCLLLQYGCQETYDSRWCDYNCSNKRQRKRLNFLYQFCSIFQMKRFAVIEPLLQQHQHFLFCFLLCCVKWVVVSVLIRTSQKTIPTETFHLFLVVSYRGANLCWALGGIICNFTPILPCFLLKKWIAQPLQAPTVLTSLVKNMFQAYNF